MKYHLNQISEKQPYIAISYRENSPEQDFFVLPSLTQSVTIPAPTNQNYPQGTLDNILDNTKTQNINLKAINQKVSNYINDMNNYLKENGSDKYLNITGVKPKSSSGNEIASVQTLYNALNNFKQSTIYLNNSNQGFYDKINKQAAFTNQTPSNMLEYVLKHELVHALGYHTESDCDAELGNWFMHDSMNAPDENQRQKYANLSDLAFRRSAEYSTQENNYN